MNEEPCDCSSQWLASLLNNDSNGNAHEHHTEQIERLRLLETLTPSVTKPRRLPNEDDLRNTNIIFEDRRKISNKGTNCNKWGGLDLIAKALEIDKEIHVKKVESRGGFFDCNICLGMPRDPIVTCCGHLFCWPCFYRVPYDIYHMRECPVCKGEVSEKNIIPVYGGNDTCQKSEAEYSRSKIPPRPKSLRVEAVRQQPERVEQRPRTGLFEDGEGQNQTSSNTSDSYYYSDSDSDDSLYSTNGTPIQRNHAEDPPLPDDTDLFRSDATIISSEYNNLDTNFVSSIHAQPPLVENRNLVVMVNQGQDLNADDQFSSIPPLPSTFPRPSNLPWTSLQVENERFLDTITGGSFEIPSSGLSTRRRSDVADSLDVDEDGVSREPRRRRLI